MTTYVATFSDGTSKMIANSVKSYTHAWKATGYRPRTDGEKYWCGEEGFARSAELGAKALVSAMNRIERPTRFKLLDTLGIGVPGIVTFHEVVPVVTR